MLPPVQYCRHLYSIAFLTKRSSKIDPKVGFLGCDTSVRGPLLPVSLPDSGPPPKVSPLLSSPRGPWSLDTQLSSTSSFFHPLSDWELIFYNCKHGYICYEVFFFGHGQPLCYVEGFRVLSTKRSFSHLLFMLQPPRAASGSS